MSKLFTPSRVSDASLVLATAGITQALSAWHGDQGWLVALSWFVAGLFGVAYRAAASFRKCVHV